MYKLATDPVLVLNTAMRPGHRRRTRRAHRPETGRATPGRPRNRRTGRCTPPPKSKNRAYRRGWVAPFRLKRP